MFFVNNIAEHAVQHIFNMSWCTILKRFVKHWWLKCTVLRLCKKTIHQHAMFALIWFNLIGLDSPSMWGLIKLTWLLYLNGGYGQCRLHIRVIMKYRFIKCTVDLSATRWRALFFKTPNAGLTSKLQIAKYWCHNVEIAALLCTYICILCT